MNGEADHVPILFAADSFTCVGELVNVIKTKTSRFARKQNGDTLLKPYNWKPLFWSDSYFVTSVSENSLTNIKTYIQNQWRHSPTPILTNGRGTLPFLIENLSLPRELHAPCGSDKERRPEALLEVFELLGDRRLGDGKRLCRCGDRALPCDDEKCPVVRRICSHLILPVKVPAADCCLYGKGQRNPLPLWSVPLAFYRSGDFL